MNMYEMIVGLRVITTRASTYNDSLLIPLPEGTKGTIVHADQETVVIKLDEALLGEFPELFIEEPTDLFTSADDFAPID